MFFFNEAALEQSIINLLENQGYKHVLGETIERDPHEILLKDDLRAYLFTRYVADGITQLEVETVVHMLEHVQGSLYNANREVLQMVMTGFSIRREDKSKPNLYIYLLNYDDPDKNNFKIVNQLEIVGEQKRIPDGIVYINGIPLVVLEFKTAIKENVTIENAFTQLTVRYRRDIEDLFKYNDRSDNTTIANEVINAVVNQMEQLLHEVNNERTAADQMGISYEEKAFYDILKAVRDKFGFEYEEDKLIHLAQEVKRIVDDKARYVDWSTRADRKAELKMDLVIILADNGYPPYTKDEVFKEILEQAENFKKQQ